MHLKELYFKDYIVTCVRRDHNTSTQFKISPTYGIMNALSLGPARVSSDRLTILIKRIRLHLRQPSE